MPAEPADQGIAEEVQRLGAPLLVALASRMPNAEARSGIAAAIAEAVARGLHDPEIDLVRECARLHEIGKLYVPAELLVRPLATLTPRQLEAVRSHHEDGRAVTEGAGLPRRASTLILHARESFDGSGPAGLEGQEIPQGSRIIAAATEYLDAPLLPGAPAGDPREIAIERIRSLAGSRLDPRVAAIAVAEIQRNR